MEYKLAVLEHLFAKVLNPSTLNKKNLTASFMNDCRLVASKEMAGIKESFSTIVFSSFDESRTELYFRQYQNGLVGFADIVFKYLQPDGVESIHRVTSDVAVLNFYKEMAAIPAQLLNFIELNFPVYFNKQVKISEADKWALVPEIKRDLKRIEKILQEFAIDEKLIDITCSPFKEFILPDALISYYDLAYLKGYRGQITAFINEKSKTDNTKDLCELLLFVNFNSLRFYNYYTVQLIEGAKAYNTLPDLIEYYSMKIKHVNQLPLKPGFVYKTKLSSIKEQLGNWICEELNYLEKRMGLLFHPAMQKTDEQSKDSKVQTRLSVSLLGMAVKLLVDSKVISNKNSAELMRIVARNFKTDRQEVISEESLRNKSYNFETATVDKLKDEIIGLLNLVRRY